MNQERLPPPLARAAMSAMPSALLQRAVDVLMERLRARHAGLFRNLERLKASSVRFEPLDVPHRFVLSFGKSGVSLAVADAKADACVKGNLSALLDMLEGRIDGDKLFFSREIDITGKAETVVALRNTLDREEIDLLDDIVSFFGPFKRPARKAVLIADALAQHLRRTFATKTVRS